MVYNNIKEYLSIQIDLFYLLKLPYDKKLRKMEKEVLLQYIMWTIKGNDINDRDVVNFIKNNLRLNSKTHVYQYKNHLKEKGWLIAHNKDSYSIIPNFDFTDREFRLEKPYKFTLRCNPPVKEVNDMIDKGFSSDGESE